MKYKTFGRTGLIVSEVSLGTMTFGGMWNSGWGTDDDKESEQIFKRFIEAVGNYIDTANCYSDGRSEELIGKFAKGMRDELIIGTKYSYLATVKRANPNYRGPRFYGSSRKRIEIDIEASLRRLNTDYIDIYWVHMYDQITPVEEIMESMNNLVRTGKIRYFGVSNVPAWVISAGNMFAKYNSMAGFSGIQVEYNLIKRFTEHELVPMANRFGMSINAYAPLAYGLLTGKYLNHNDNKDLRLNILDPFNYLTDEHNIRVTQTVVDIAKEIGRTPAEVAINWVQYTNPNVIAILGAKNVEQLNTNLSALEFELPAEARARLDKVSTIPNFYPNDAFIIASNKLNGGDASKVQIMQKIQDIRY